MSKHKVLAVLMAPFLAIGGYIIAGYFVDNEPPMRAFVLEKECYLSKNKCVLKTLGLELKLSADQELQPGSSVNITVVSSAKLNDVLIELAEKKSQSQPGRLKEKEDNVWRGDIILSEKTDVSKLMLRLVVNWQDNIYFADEKIKQ